MAAPSLLSVRTSRVKAIGRAVSSVRDTLTGIALESQLERFMISRVRRRFDTQRSPEGEPWKPVRPESRYGATNKNLGQALINTGQLRRSITVLRRDRDKAFSVNTGAGFRIGIKPTEQYVGGKYSTKRTVKVADVGSVHNYGFGHIPKRTFMGVGQDDVSAVERFLARRMKAKGL